MENEGNITQSEYVLYETENVAPDGDMLLIIGPLERRIRVLSIILMNGSKPFSKLLGPDFAEGRALRKHLNNDPSQPVHVPLPEDDFEAILIICNILHGRSRKLAKALNPTEVLNVAVAADKWDVTIPLSWAAKDWLKCEGITNSQELWSLMLAAYLLDDVECFGNVTAALVLHHSCSKSYLELGADTSVVDESKQFLIRGRSSLPRT